LECGAKLRVPQDQLLAGNDGPRDRLHSQA
jgi:hypothetical protein